MGQAAREIQSVKNGFFGVDINKYQSVQRLVRKDIDGDAEMTGYSKD